MLVLKFGGSSLAKPGRIQNVLDIVADTAQHTRVAAVVCSAFGGVTDSLITMGRRAAARDESFRDRWSELVTRHLEAAEQLLEPEPRIEIQNRIRELTNDLQDVLHGVFLIRELSPRTQDYLTSFGERLCAHITAAALNQKTGSAEFLDARLLVRTDDQFGCAKVDHEITARAIRDHFDEHPKTQVVTGFIGRTEKQQTTTLGRGGTDYTAAIFGAALNATEVQIWTDVNGFLTADPRKVNGTSNIPEISYTEALEMAHFGAKVIYPPTLAPVLPKKIPVRVKNTFEPHEAGTLIQAEAETGDHRVRGISSIDKIALLKLEGCGLVGVAGICNRLFGALARAGINVILISQSSSEHSICLAISPEDASSAHDAVTREFEYEMLTHKVDSVTIEDELSVIAVVGEGMRHQPGVAGKVFAALGKHHINVAAIAQGSSEFNLSLVVRQQEHHKALNVLHQAFFSDEPDTIHLALIGVGLIGRTLLSQIKALNESENSLPTIKVVAASTSRSMLFAAAGLAVADLPDKLRNTGQPADSHELLGRFKALSVPRKIWVDCTAGDAIPSLYQEALSAGISVVTPNKKGNSGPYAEFVKLHQCAHQNGAHYRYEANVGAALPLIDTVNQMRDTGDNIQSIEAVLSGSLSFILNGLEADTPLSDQVRTARTSGFTEPDPREDLSGQDVARKLLILARVCGMALEPADIELTPLLEEHGQPLELDTWLDSLPLRDEEFEAKRTQAQSRGRVLRYLASLRDGKAKVSLAEVASNHPAAALQGADNLMVITSDRYHQTPWVIRGPGAGAELTAGQVLSDILRC